jgi:hypothetical protein
VPRAIHHGAADSFPSEGIKGRPKRRIESPRCLKKTFIAEALEVIHRERQFLRSSQAARDFANERQRCVEAREHLRRVLRRLLGGRTHEEP